MRVVEYLIEQCNANVHAGDDGLDYALRMAAWNGHLSIVKYLMKKRADTQNNYSLSSDEYIPLSIVEYLREKQEGKDSGKDSALHSAAASGQLSVLEYLIEEGADIHFKHDKALRSAAEFGHLQVVKCIMLKCERYNSRLNYIENLTVFDLHQIHRSLDSDMKRNIRENPLAYKEY